MKAKNQSERQKTILAERFIDDLKGKNPGPPISGYSLFIFGSGYNTAKYFQNVFKKEVNYSLINFRYDGQTQLFLTEDVWKQYVQEVFASYLRNPRYVKTVEENFYKNFPKIDKLYEKYSYAKIKQEPEAILLPIVRRTFDLFWITNAWSHFSMYFDVDLCFSIVKSVYPKTTQKEIKKIWLKATELIEESFDKAQKRDILEKIYQNKKIDLVEYCQYFWTSYKNVSPLKDVEKKLKEEYGQFIGQREKAKKHLDQMDKALVQKRKQFAIWYKGLSATQKKVVKFCQTIMEIRDKRKNHFAKGITIAWRIAEKIFTEAKIDKNSIENILVFEELLKGANFVKTLKSELKKREKSYIVYVPYRGPKIVSYNNAEQNYALINDYFLSGHQSNNNEITGQSGNKGKTRGKVRIIHSIKDFSLFKKGEILVAGMTRPEFVPLMRQAKAIITDEGGITCHAAIVSRELNKPCIIGTRVATRILNDGDEVEVDGNKGIVTLLSPSKK